MFHVAALCYFTNVSSLSSSGVHVGLQKGVIRIQASFNNTIITVTDVRGQVILWCSAGACGFRETRKSTPFATQAAAAAENAIRASMDRGMKQAEVMMSGPGPGRDTALRAIRAA